MTDYVTQTLELWSDMSGSMSGCEAPIMDTNSTFLFLVFSAY